MATIDSAPAGGLRTQAPRCDAQLAAAFHRARSNNKPGIWRRKIERVDGASDPAERELSFGPSACSRQDGYCWKMTSLSISAAALSIF